MDYQYGLKMHIEKMKKYLIFILLSIGIQLKAQLSTFDNPHVPIISGQVNSIDSLLDDNYLEIYFELDSVEITGKIWGNKFETLNDFQNSGTKLKIDFYLQNDELLFIRVVEDSEKYTDLAAKNTDFYFHNRTLSLVWDYYKRPTGLAMRLEEDINSFYGYNKNLNEEFLKEYVYQLFKRIKTTANKLGI
jgi:hypothetical protein